MVNNFFGNNFTFQHGSLMSTYYVTLIETHVLYILV